MGPFGGLSIRQLLLPVPYGKKEKRKKRKKGYQTVRKNDDTFSRFDKIPGCDGQTDRHLATVPVRALRTHCAVKRSNPLAILESLVTRLRHR